MAEQKRVVNVATTEDEKSQQKSETKGLFHYLLVILRYLLFLVILSIFIVAVTVLTVRSLQDQYKITNNPSSFIMDVEQNVQEELAWFQQVGEIRGNLLDAVQRKVFIADVYLGYPLDDQQIVQELTRKTVQIKERLSLYFSSKYSIDLEGNQNFIKMKIELKELVNRILNNKIREVAFNNFQIVSF